MAQAERRQLAPALTASALLHLVVIGAGFVAWPWIHKVVPVNATPVTLLTSADLARLTAAQRSETPSPAQAPDSQPEATPAPPPAPEPAPTPIPPPAPAPQPKAAPAQKPVPKPVEKAPPPKPVPVTKTPPAQTKSLDLDALAKSLAQNTKAAGPVAPKVAAAKGPPKPETDLSDRAPDGQARATSTTALGQIRDKLIRLWNPNCGVETAANVHILVRMNLNPDGSLAGQPGLADYPGGINSIADPLLKASAIRALSAVSRGAPYDNLPKADYSYWKTVALNFDAKQACGGQ
jgi:outer membrane biosynthesis protein TonB